MISRYRECSQSVASPALPVESHLGGRLPHHSRYRPFYPHQKDAFAFARGRERCALFMEMRLGKTMVAIRWAKAHRLRRVLIVAPFSCFPSWAEELDLENCSYQILIGTRKQRLAKLAEEYRFSILNKEGFLAIPEISKIPWDGIILDESVFIKNPKAKVTKFYTTKMAYIPYRMILTGLPNPESDLEFYSQFKFLLGSFCGIHNYWAFRSRYFIPSGFGGYEWRAKKGVPEMIATEVNRNAFILRRKDAGRTIPSATEIRSVDFPPSIRKIYKRLERDFILSSEFTEDKAVIHGIAQYVHLRKMCSGIVEESIVWDGKIKEVNELLAGELRGEQCVIWFSYRRAQAEMLRKIKCESVASIDGSTPIFERMEIQAKFKMGQIQILLAQVAVAETGINLSAADTAIYFTEPPGLNGYRQSKDRILDLRKTTTLLYLPLIVPNSVEEDLHVALRAKSYRSEISLSRVLRERLLERIGGLQ